MLKLRLEGRTYQYVADKAGLTRQRIQQILSPPAPIRDYVVQKYDGYCDNCGIYVGPGGHVHHEGTSGEEDYNDLENLQLLCLSCHMKKHAKPPQFQCMNCGKPIRKGIFCSPKCFAQYHMATLICSYCGKTFSLNTAKAYWRTVRSKSGLVFCNRICHGKWAGKNYGRKNKWDYEKIYKTRDDTGFGAIKLSRLLNIPVSSLTYILRKRNSSV